MTNKAREVLFESFIFEIRGCAPTYILSVNSARYRDTALSEHLGVDIAAECIFPEKLAGRTAMITLAARRDSLTPEAFKEDSDWVPNCIGALELAPGRGRFYTDVPHESFGVLTTLLAQRLLRFVVLYGSPLKRGRSLCSSMQIEHAINLEDY